MKITPLELRKHQFKKGFKVSGYDPEEVNSFIRQMADQWSEVLEDLRLAESRVSELENKLKHYEQVELALQEALETARGTARQLEDSATQKAKLVVEEAELRAQRLLQDAEQERYSVRKDIVKLNSRQSEIAAKMRAFLMAEMEVLAQFQGDEHAGFIKLMSAEESGAADLLPKSRAQLEQASIEEPDADDQDEAVDAADEQLEAETVVDESDEQSEEHEVEAAQSPSTDAKAEPVDTTVSEPKRPEPKAAPASTTESESVPERVASEDVNQEPVPEPPKVPRHTAPPPPVRREPTATPEPPPPPPVTPSPQRPPRVPQQPASREQPYPPPPPVREVPPSLPKETGDRPTYRDMLSDTAAGSASPDVPDPFDSPFFNAKNPDFSQDRDDAVPGSDAAQGWSLRSLVTGEDQSEKKPRSSVDERERIRRILEDLD